VPGSVGIPLNHLTARLDELPRDRPIVVYCAGGYRSSIAASLLQLHGFERVAEIAGGMAAWDAARLPIS
jgi:rhodanese-related sulfurtransferase